MTSDITRITVSAAEPYDVLLGWNLEGLFPDILGEQVQRVAIIHTASVELSTLDVARELQRAGYTVCDLTVPEGEPAKTAGVLASCWARLGQEGFTRSDAIVSVGGGAVTDLAGFVAATFLRGIAVVHLPTSLLGMVDAAVGGKTGINTAEGKNLVGAFYEPRAVICDLAALHSLPQVEMINGLAEVIKCGFIRDTAILDTVARHPRAVSDHASSELADVVRRAVQVKADVVSGDLRESTSRGSAVGRETLNYGHTFGHALELVENFGRRHGEAVSIGMVYVAELAERHGRVGADVVSLHRDLLRSVGLPTTYSGGDWGSLVAGMRLDKKTRGTRLRFVTLDTHPGQVSMLEGPDESVLEASFRALSR